MWQIGRCLPPHYPMQLSESPSVFHSSPLSEGQRYTRCEGCRWSLPPFTPTCQHVPWRGCDSNLSFHVPPLMSEKFCRAQPLLLTLSQSFLRSPTHSSLCRGSGVAKTREVFCGTKSVPQGDGGSLENTQRGLVPRSFHSNEKKSMQACPQLFSISSVAVRMWACPLISQHRPPPKLRLSEN